MNRFLYCLIVLAFMSCSQQAQELSLDQFKVAIPAGFKQLKVNEEKDELLKLNYQDELFIIVQDNIGDIIEGYQKGLIDPLQYVQSLKFTALQSAYKGTNASQAIKGELNGHSFISQSFYSNEERGEVYYEYRIMKIGENYFEFIVTGLKAAKERHTQLINDFFAGIEL